VAAPTRLVIFLAAHTYMTHDNGSPITRIVVDSESDTLFARIVDNDGSPLSWLHVASPRRHGLVVLL